MKIIYKFQGLAAKLSIGLLLTLTACASVQQIPEDKVLHFLAGGYVAASGYYAADDFNINRKVTAIGLSTAIGTAKEIWDYNMGRPFDYKDLLVTAFGGVVVTYTLELLKKKKNERKTKKNN